MSPSASQKFRAPPRVKLTDEIEKQFKDKIFRSNIADLAKRTRLPYMLVYNIVNRRVKSISQRNFQLIFGEAPPLQMSPKVDGAVFRNLARLWLYLNDHQTHTGLYHTLFPEKRDQRPDYRIFTGQVKTVDIALERKMLRKFQEHGLEPAVVFEWIDEMNATPLNQRIPYRRIRPHLLFLREKIGIHPNAILNQLFDRYEKGALQSVPRHVYERALALHKKAEAALSQGTRLAMERIREEVYGRKAGYTLYSEISAELKFLREHAYKSAKQYLGRSISIYDKGLCKRIPSSKASVISKDCAAFIGQHQELPLSALPPRHRREKVSSLMGVLINRTTDLMIQDKGVELEKQILAPAGVRDAYKNEASGFTRFDSAARVLGMRQQAFDLMVAKNCRIFREVGRYDRRWYLSDLYLKELSRNPDFPLLTAKYERLSRRLKQGGTGNNCMN